MTLAPQPSDPASLPTQAAEQAQEPAAEPTPGQAAEQAPEPAAAPAPAAAEQAPAPAFVPTARTEQADPAVPQHASTPEPAPEPTADRAPDPDPDPDPNTNPEPAQPDAAQPSRGTRPRFGTVSMPSRAPARRREMPSVRAVRLTDEPPAPVDRPAAATPAAVTPVPLPVPRPGTGAVPTESRTEEPQP
ncbi:MULTISPECIES: hypothetical protein [Streptomyces]|uniref:Uncharacterized protein n=1 Tax=Streptomyces viridochromogenes TaxID=1938 RepID=A0A0L8LE08_STRVR|nr:MULTISPECIES: hypothetical protein [Streptomyces]KOG36508.1 hypothetical protein ADK34_01845 [Streptomyces viridochromogenes]